MSEPVPIPAGCDPLAAERWTQRLARWTQSGLSAAAFCDAEGITKSNFFRWKRRLAGTTTPAATAQRPRTTKTQPPKTAIVPIRLAPADAHTHPIELALPSGTVLRLPADVRPELIVAILRGLETRPC